jgi:hypothetical protein
MRKVTVFKGIVNGKEFDNVADYNAALTTLMDAGETDIQATSSTSIKTIEDEASTACTPDQCPGTCTSASVELPVDEDLSFYPYMEDEDPFYLDLLVTNDPVKNCEAYNAAQKVLEKCYRYIKEALYNPDSCQCERKDYLADVQDIIYNIKKDMNDTIHAEKSIVAKREKLTKEYNEALKLLDNEEYVLSASMDVSKMFDAFYSDVENETLTAIKEFEKTNNCDKNVKIFTDCVEKQPERVANLSDLLDKIFGPGLMK